MRLGWILSGLLLAGSHDWKPYANVRFGYQVEYPADLVKAEPESDNSDGRHFTARRGSADFAVWGAYIVEGDLYADDLRRAEQECVGGKAAYKMVRSRVWVVSCPLAGGGILYSKALRRKDTLSRFEARYPAGEKATWDEVTAHMAATLTGPRTMVPWAGDR